MQMKHLSLLQLEKKNIIAAPEINQLSWGTQLLLKSDSSKVDFARLQRRGVSSTGGHYILQYIKFPSRKLNCIRNIILYSSSIPISSFMLSAKQGGLFSFILHYLELLSFIS